MKMKIGVRNVRRSRDKTLRNHNGHIDKTIECLGEKEGLHRRMLGTWNIGTCRAPGCRSSRGFCYGTEKAER
eukprot:4975490-Prymnesium_polylepis.1